MKAVQFAQYGGPEVLQVYDAPDPIPDSSDVLIQVKAFKIVMAFTREIVS